MATDVGATVMNGVSSASVGNVGSHSGVRSVKYLLWRMAIMGDADADDGDGDGAPVCADKRGRFPVSAGYIAAAAAVEAPAAASYSSIACVRGCLVWQKTRALTGRRSLRVRALASVCFTTRRAPQRHSLFV